MSASVENILFLFLFFFKSLKVSIPGLVPRHGFDGRGFLINVLP